MSSEKDTNGSQSSTGEGLGQTGLGSDLLDENGRPIEAVYHVPVRISAVLGKAMMPVNQLLKLTRGSVVELDRRVGEPVDVFVNDRLVARGEVVIVEDRLGITMTEIVRS
ncbi:MAG: flagellar motor switch protein FliN [Alphaproteobacteria bacterium]|mgnify:CR=1 FL=1|nr:flagellar motor switch protein FliN [Alphaproteobacteria bacterium]OJV46612.1 MAG: flagellar motor switch protein FliN [Alphaproteobacteria bacterium 43-37]